MTRPSSGATCLAALALALALPACKDTSTASRENPTPGVVSLAPAEVVAGSADFELNVTGSDFVSGSVARWNGVDLSTRYVSPTQLTATVTAPMVVSVGLFAVSVFNPAPGGGVSNSRTFAVTVRVNPTPTLTSLAPTEVEAGSPGATLILTGAGFVSGSKAYTGQTLRQTEYVSPTQLRVTLSAAEVASVGTLQFRVSSPGPGGGPSGTVPFVIRAPVPAIASISPTQSTAGAPSLELTANGSGFLSNSEVHFNGAARPTILVSPGQLKVTLAAADLQAPGTFQITVVNQAPGGGTSNAASLVLVTGVPTISLLSSYGATAGRSGFTLMLHGTGFIKGAVVRWNGADRPTTYVSSSRLAVSVSAADVAVPGAAQITVFNPAPGGGTSAPQTLQVRALAAPAVLDLKTLDLPAQDVAFSSSTGRLYASFPGSSPQYGNSVAAVDPATGAVTGSVFVGSGPSVLALARDQSILYVALDGTGTVRRVTPSTLTAGLEFTAGRVEEMETRPGDPSALAIALMNPSSSSNHAGVCLYDDGIKRSRCTDVYDPNNSIEFDETGSVLYGHDNLSTAFAFRTILVLSDGLQQVRSSDGLITAFYSRIHYGSGRVYSTNGEVIDAERGVRVGNFSGGLASDALPDPVLGRVFSVYGNGTLRAWDMNTFTQLGSITIPGFTNEDPAVRRVRIVRWGTDGLAISDGHKLFIVRTTLAAP
jgi:hypothetical protein